MSVKRVPYKPASDDTLADKAMRMIAAIPTFAVILGACVIGSIIGLAVAL